MNGEQIRSRSAGIVALGTLLVAVFGALTQIAIAARFGASRELDAFYAALVLPNTLVSILIGSLTSVFLPMFIEQRNKHGEREAWRLTETLVGTFGLLLLAISVVAFLGAEPLLGLTAPGLTLVARVLAARLLRILLTMLVIGGLVSIASSLLNAHHRFTGPAAANVMRSLVYLTALWPLTLVRGITGLATAMIMGHIAALIVVLAALRPWRFGFRPRLDLSSPAYRRLVSVWLALLFSIFIARLYPILDRYYASQLAVGSISYLAYATSINGLVLSLFSASMAKVIFPAIAEDIAADRPQRAIDRMSQTIRLSTFIVVPAIIGLLTLRKPIIAMLLQRGAFDATDTAITASVLLFAAGSLFGPVIANVTSKMLYSLQATRFIFWLNALRIPIYVALCEWLIGPLGILGVALAGSITVTLGWPMQLAYLRYRLGPLALGQLSASIGASFGRALIMGLIVHFSFGWLESYLAWPPTVAVLASVAVGVATYVLLSRLLAPGETGLFADRLGRAVGIAR